MLACLYDVHGNLRALEAVLADAQAAGATSFALGGDYAALGPEPEETVARLAALEAAVRLAGNWERWAAHPGDAPEDPVVQGGAAACRAALGEELIAELAELPAEARLGDATLVHASVISDVRSFAPEPGAEDDELAGDVTTARLIFGHTHLAFRRPGPRGLELLNPGSVGMPLDGDPRAAYVLMHDDGSLEPRRVAYDNAAAAAALRARYDGAWAGTIAGRLETARP